ncbi:hypothetical protein V0288_23090 [Pannus brasiliensis CCIBt3594]|uniref:Uncharacterized protein n=1 Tax=Pannus brasiliensis CCIBt3594 TaxID=1427578 RepID=A0AAW9R0X6_9CHRO
MRKAVAWTNGQPFLTQKICRLIRETSAPIPTNDEAVWLQNLIQTHVIRNWEAQDEPEHLKTIRDRLLGSPRSLQLLELYGQVSRRTEAIAVDHPAIEELLLSGLVIEREGSLKVANRIYGSIFDREWLDRQMARSLQE